MGYRAHTVTQQREYGSSLFLRWDEFEKLYDHLSEKYGEDYQDFYRSEAEEYYEVPPEALEKEIEELKKLPSEENCEFGELTNGELIETLQQSLNESKDPGVVAWEWF